MDSIGNIKYVQVDGSESLAKTYEDKANVFCDYFSSVCVVENNAPFETPQTNETLSSMPNKSFQFVYVVTRLKILNVNKSEVPDGIHPTRVLDEILAYLYKNNFK